MHLLKSIDKRTVFFVVLSLLPFNLYLKGVVLQSLLLIFIVYVIRYKTLPLMSVKTNKYPLLLAILFAILYIPGFYIYNYDSLDPFLHANYLLNMVNIAGLTALFYGLLSILFFLFQNPEGLRFNGNKWAFFENKTFFIYIWMLIFASWIPYLIINFPGIVTLDGLAQIKKNMGDMPLNSMTTIFYTIYIGIFIKFGLGVFNSMNAVVAIHALFQMLCISGVFAFTVNFLNKRNVSKPVVLFAILFYAFYPVHGMYAVSIWSDPMFSAAIVMLMVCLTMLAVNSKSFFQRPYYLLFIISASLVSLFRLNGIHIFMLTVLFLFVLIKEARLKLFYACGICLLLFIAGNVMPAQIKKVPETVNLAYLTIPIQQLARTMSKHEAELSANDMKGMEKFFNVKNLTTEYDPEIVDPSRRLFNRDYYNEHKSDFIKFWYGMFCKYPQTFVESFISSIYGYWYPEVKYWIFGAYIVKNNYEIHQVKLMPKTISPGVVIKFVDWLRSVPVVSLFFSIGFVVWTTFISCVISITRRQKRMLVFIPLLGVLLTAMASPVFAEFRYIYAFFAAFPLVVALPFLVESKIESNTVTLNRDIK